jgi:U3 small nucleolar RNA-associated protein 14
LGPSLKVSKKNEVVLSKESKSAEKSKNKLKKQELKHDEERARVRDDAELEISTGNVLTLQASSSKKTAKALGKRPAGPNTSLGAADDSDNDSDANSEVDAQERALSAKSKGKGKAGPSAIQQRDLVALAFAGDNVVKVSAPMRDIWVILTFLAGVRRDQKARDCGRRTQRGGYDDTRLGAYGPCYIIRTRS